MSPLSTALMRALVGDGEMTPELMGEWQTKRPDEYRQHKLRAIRSALRWMQSGEVVSGRLATKRQLEDEPRIGELRAGAAEMGST